MSLYDRAALLSERMLIKQGETATLRRVTSSGGGPSDPTGGAETVTDYACKVAVFPIDQKDVDGTTIKAGDFKVIMSPSVEVEPKTTDRLICSAGTLSILDAGRFAPAGIVTHYKMHGRK